MSNYDNEISRVVWRKASYSNGNGGCCVEFAEVGGVSCVVRDSKDPAGPVLTFPSRGWCAFTAGVRAGEFG